MEANATDYYETLLKEFPGLTKKQLSKIINKVSDRYWYVLSKGGGVRIDCDDFKMDTTNRGVTNMERLEVARRMSTITHRFRFGTKKPAWNGKYYFGVDKSRDKNKILGSDIYKLKGHICYKNKHECFATIGNKYFFEFSFPADVGNTFYDDNAVACDVKYIGRKENGNIRKI